MSTKEIVKKEYYHFGAGVPAGSYLQWSGNEMVEFGVRAYNAGVKSVNTWVEVTPDTLPEVGKPYMIYDTRGELTLLYEKTFWPRHIADIHLSPEQWKGIFYCEPPTKKRLT